MEIVKGKIVEWREDGTVLICATLPNIDKAIKRKYGEAVIGLDDGRRISPEQRRKCYALIREIADWMGDFPENVKQFFKMNFIVERLQSIERQMFSLSDVDMTTARMFIDYLVSFIIEWEIPTKEPLSQYCEDIQRFVYACMKSRRCIVCGKQAQFCHYDSVGMGRNRSTISMIGMKVFPACAKHHEEAHRIGHKSWMEKYHVEPIALTEELAKIWGLTKKNMKEVGTD